MTFEEHFKAEGRQKGRQEGRLEGRLEGRQEATLEITINLLKDNTLPNDRIAAIAGLTLETIQALQKALQ